MRWQLERFQFRNTTALLLTLFVFACGGGGGASSGSGSSSSGASSSSSTSGAGSSSQSSAAPVVTAVGMPAGAVNSQSIGPSGGTLSSLDGQLTITIPAGAVSAATTFSVQPVTNQLPTGLGLLAYRLEPSGQTFSVPLQLTFAYDAASLNANNPGLLGVFFQTAQGTWQAVASPAVDTTKQTITVSTTHFADYSPALLLDIAPESASVAVGKSVKFAVYYAPGCLITSTCAGGEEDDDLLAPLVPVASTGTFAVNNIVGGDPTVGTIDANGTYTAPSTPPSPATVTVTFTATGVSAPSDKQIALAPVTIYGQEYMGTVEFSDTTPGGSYSGTATVVLAPTGPATADGTVALKTVSGTVSIDSFAVTNCSLVSNTVAINGSSTGGSIGIVTGSTYTGDGEAAITTICIEEGGPTTGPVLWFNTGTTFFNVNANGSLSGTASSNDFTNTWTFTPQ